MASSVLKQILFVSLVLPTLSFAEKWPDKQDPHLILNKADGEIYHLEDLAKRFEDFSKKALA